MPRLEARNGRATMVNANRPDQVYGDMDRPKLDNLRTRVFLRRGLDPLKRGDTVHTAYVDVPIPAAWAGLRDLTLRRVVKEWQLRALTWNTQPGVLGAASVVTVGAVPAGYVARFDVAADLQAWLDAGGGIHPGWRIATSDTVTREINAGAAVVVVEYSTPSTAPVDLSPAGGAVSVSKPVLQFRAASFTAAEVQVDAGGNFTTPAFSAVVETTVPQVDLAATSYPGLVSGASTTWRVRTRSREGQWSPWSAAVSFSRTAKPTATITTGSTVGDSQATLTAAMAGLTRAQWLVAPATDPSRLLYDSGILPPSGASHMPSVPVFTVDGAYYVVTFRGWDSVPRESTPGDPPWSETTITVRLDYSDVLGGPDALTATQPTRGHPLVRVQWTDAAPAAEAFTVERSDGWVRRFEAADVLVSGSTFRLDDYGCPPNQAITYRVRPHADDQTGAGVTVTVTTDVPVRWLVDPETGESVPLLGRDVGSWLRPEAASLHAPEASAHVIRRRTGKRAPEGDITATVADSPHGQASVALERLERWADPEQTPAAKVFRLVVGDESRPVWIGNVDLAPSPLTRPGAVVKAASFSFWTAPEPT